MTNPPRHRPLNWCVSRRKALALPSNQVLPFVFVQHSRRCSPFPSEKYVPMARSPEWPKGGLPKSCARQATDTMAPISDRWLSFSSRCRASSFLVESLPNERPTHDTSRLCVSRLCTKIPPGSGNTCVLFCSDGREPKR